MLAYIDAGLGAMLLQWLIAVVIGSIIYFRGGLQWFFSLFTKKKRGEKDSASDAGQREEVQEEADMESAIGEGNEREG